jgi:hypothetical protein
MESAMNRPISKFLFMAGRERSRLRSSNAWRRAAAEIGEQMAAAHRIYPVVDTDPRLVELLKLVEELRAAH